MSLVGTLFLLLTTSGVAAAAQETRDPVEVFEHLGEQRDDLVADVVGDGAAVTTLPDGGFLVGDPSPRSQWVGNARRPLEPASIRFDASTGVITFDFRELGLVKFAPVDREAPTRLTQNGAGVVAYGIDKDLDEVTLASHELVEQHLVVDPRHSGNKLIQYSYDVILPPGASAEMSGGDLYVSHGMDTLVIVRADYAMDEAGNELPASLSHDAAANRATVTYDGRSEAPVGSVAIDPVFLSEASAKQFLMKVCQGGTSTVCDVQEDETLPPGFGTYSFPTFNTSAKRTWGLFVGTKKATDYGSGHFGSITYTPPKDTKVAKAYFRGEISDPSHHFSCRVELLRANAVVKSSDWVSTPAESAALPFDVNAILGDDDDLADQAALRFQKTTADSYTSPEENSSRCWMPHATVAAGTGDRFDVWIEDLKDPTISSSPDLPNPETTGLNVVGDVTTAGGFNTTAHQYDTNRWYTHGSDAAWAMFATDEGSGVDRVEVWHVAPRGSVGAVQNTGASVDLCEEAAHNTSGPPCPLQPGIRTSYGFINANNSKAQGLNRFWYTAFDFAGRRVSSEAMYYLYDDVAPLAPAPVTGSDSEATMPVIDADNTVRVEWLAGSDPGYTPSTPRTGSGLSKYVGRIEHKVNGQWVQFRDGTFSSLRTATQANPNPPLAGLIDAEIGEYRYRLQSVDQAGNVGAWGSWSHFAVDTTPPVVKLLKPTVGFTVGLRRANEPSSLSVSVDEEDPRDVIDEAGIQFRDEQGQIAKQDAVQRGFRDTANPTKFDLNIDPPSAGHWELTAYAKDSMHFAKSGIAFVCADTSITPDDTGELAISPEYMHLMSGGSIVATRIRFNGSGSYAKTKAWIIERRENGASAWRLAGRVAALTDRDYDFDDWTPATATTQWRVSPAVLPCTRSGATDIARVATGISAGTASEAPRPRESLLGLEHNWSFQDLPLGGGSDAFVNIATGNVVATRTVLSEPGRGLGTDVQLTYNSQQLGSADQLATSGVAGAHVTLSIGNVSGAGTGALSIGATQVGVRDADGTMHAFTKTGGVPWDGTYVAPPGVRLALRDVTAPATPADDQADPGDPVRFKLTRPDGLTYHYGDDRTTDPQDPSIGFGSIRKVTDREGHTLRYVYECVAVTPRPLVRVTPLTGQGGTWSVRSSNEPFVTAACPDDSVATTGTDPSADRMLRLVAVRDAEYAADGQREVTVSYVSANNDEDGHVAEIRGHASGQGSRRVKLDYSSVSGVVRLQTIREYPRGGGAPRTVTMEYDASLDDPGAWFDQSVLLKSMSDLKGQSTRFTYAVPDGAGRLTANPRAVLVENRDDVRHDDGVGIALRYRTGDDGMLNGQTILTDQLERRTSYAWHTDPAAPSAYGRVTQRVDASGLATTVKWNDLNEVVSTELRASRVIREPVRIVGTSASRVLNGPFDGDSNVLVEDEGMGGALIDVTGDMTIGARGVISMAPPRAGQPLLSERSVYVTYTPAAERTVTERSAQDPISGAPVSVTTDQRWSVLPDGTSQATMGTVPGYREYPATNLTHTPSSQGVPARLRSFVTELRSVSTPLGHATVLTTDSLGRVTTADSPSPNADSARVFSHTSYYANGDVRSTTDAAGWTVAFWAYSLDGQPRHVSKRFKTSAVGWLPDGTDAQIAQLNLPEAFAIVYDEDARTTCVRDLRGGADEANRFVTYDYDGHGNLVAESTPWKTEGGRRYRRLATHSVDANGNPTKTVRNRVYSLASGFAAADCTVDLSSADAGVALPAGVDDVEYDVLDRTVVERQLPNDDTGSERKTTTTYNRAGDAVRTVQPRGNASAEGGDYSVSYLYDGAGRVTQSTDGEQRRSCSYYDQWSNVVFATASRWQGSTPCPAAANQGTSTQFAYDNGGSKIWTQSPSGQRSANLLDAESNPVYSRETDQEIVGNSTKIRSSFRESRRGFGPTGLPLSEQLPERFVCVNPIISTCSADSDTERVPVRTMSYDALGRLIASRSARQQGETGSTSSTSNTYGYDADGNRIVESVAVKDADLRVTRTSYDDFGNPIGVTLPGPASWAIAARVPFTTAFQYLDDDAPSVKQDRPHDNDVVWTYDRNGQMTTRTEEVYGVAVDKEWKSVQRYTYWQDGSIRTSPYTTQVFKPNARYVRGTCLRAADDESTGGVPVYVYRVASNKSVATAKGAPNWSDVSWDAGEVRKTGGIRLVKEVFSAGALHTYDENGQEESIRGCGVHTDWLERDGTGLPLRTRDIHGGVATYRYGPGGELLDERVGERVFRNAYIEPDADPASPNPGAGMVDIASLITPSETISELRLNYTYTLGGSVDRVDRFRRGGYTGKGAPSTQRVNHTVYDYDIAGVLSAQSTWRYSNKSGVGSVGAINELVASEQVVRDLDGNPRWIKESQRLADKKTGTSPVRSRTKQYSYDLMERTTLDKVGTRAQRGYEHDVYGRLTGVTSGTADLEQRLYGTIGPRGAMLPRAIQSRDVATKPFQLTALEYGSGTRTGDEPGPRGQLVHQTRYVGANATTGNEHKTEYAYTSLNQLARATDTSYTATKPKKASKAKKTKVNAKAKAGAKPTTVQRASHVESEWTHYDLLGRRVALIQSADDPRNNGGASYTDTSLLYAGAAVDPFGEISSNPNDPDVRWVHRVGGTIVGEVRNSRSRYMIANLQGSTAATLDGGAGSDITATFDYDTYGTKEKASATSFASGILKETNANSYGYTGMRQNAVGGIANHHARDYNATLKSWLQTDQYVDPWRDVGLSLDRTTQDRHGYALGNPVGNVDTDGHRITTGDSNAGGTKIHDPRQEAGPGSGTIHIPDKCKCPWVYNPGTRPGDPDHQTGASRPTATVLEGTPRYSTTARAAATIDAFWAGITPFDGKSPAQAEQDTLDASWKCGSAKHASGRGAMVSSSECVNSWSAFLPIPGGGGGAGKGVAKATATAASRGTVRIGSKQFVRKFQKHGGEFGLTGSYADRMLFRDYVQAVVANPNQVRRGPYHPKAGGGSDYMFYRSGTDLVITDGSGEFVTAFVSGNSKWWREASVVE